MLLRLLAIPVLTLVCTPLAAQWQFIRGDGNGDGSVDVADPISTLDHLFTFGPSLCRDAMDGNDDGLLDIADAVYVLSFLFAFGPVPSSPFPGCGIDPTLDLLDCLGPLVGCPSAMMPCFDSADCPPDFYCEKDEGDCDGMGVCMPIPVFCTDDFDPVCGCDGQTYTNACQAAMAGVSILAQGECTPGLCFTNDDCPLGFYCQKDVGDCDGPGVCTQIPFLCPLIFDPVCGCDGMTYSNACFAAAAGVSLESEDPCP